MTRFLFCLTGTVADVAMLPQTNGAPADSHQICNIAEHHHLVRHLFVFFVIYYVHNV